MLPSVGFGGLTARARPDFVQTLQCLLREGDVQRSHAPFQLNNGTRPDDWSSNARLLQKPR